MRLSVLVLLGLMVVAGCSERIEERNWVTMGTAASIKTKRASEIEVNGCATMAREAAAEMEKLLNAHDANSELSRLAVLLDEEVIAKCDPRVRPCYEAAFKLRNQSGGAFNPRWKGPGTMDLGAIAKGYAVDVLFRQVSADNGSQMLIDIGGNLRCHHGEWTVGIAGTSETLILTNGMACATSAEYFRGKHIYDARTGRAVTNDLLSVTIVHPSSAMLADGLSTIGFILGEKEGAAFLKRHYPEARAIWVKK